MHQCFVLVYSWAASLLEIVVGQWNMTFWHCLQD